MASKALFVSLLFVFFTNLASAQVITPAVTFTSICSSASCAFVNNQTTTITGCVQGYVLNSTTGSCVPSVINTQSYTSPPVQNTSSTQWVFLIAVFVFLMILILIGTLYYRDFKDKSTNKSKSAANHNMDGDSDSPISILKQRYANGEITKKEYEIMKNDLE